MATSDRRLPAAAPRFPYVRPGRDPLIGPETGPVCYLVVGNHRSHLGIIEMMEALLTYFSSRYPTYVSHAMVPGAVNILIDEFSFAANVEVVLRQKASHPTTRVILMATEFVTPLSLAGLPLATTFNYFGLRRDWRDFARWLAFTTRARHRPPYNLARYLGLLRVLPAVDLVLCSHQGIADSFSLIPPPSRDAVPTPLVLYPVFDVDRLIADARLHTRPPGFMMTGTLTPHRAEVGRQLVEIFRRISANGEIYHHVPFDEASAPSLTEQGVDLKYQDVAMPSGDIRTEYLYNLNPPQHATWGFSSPMRLQRAILRGQVPVVTRRFGDHPIEAIAREWMPSPEVAEQLWSDATFGRIELVRRHLDAVTRYNAIAETRNALIDAALAAIL